VINLKDALLLTIVIVAQAPNNSKKEKDNHQNQVFW